MAAVSPSTLAFARFLCALLVGPVFGTLVFIAAFAIAEWDDNSSGIAILLADIFEMFGLGYLLGLLPAGLGGLAFALFARYEPKALRQVLGSIPLGGVAGATGIYGVVLFFGASDYFQLPFYLLGALAGAIALPLCATLFLWLVQPRLQAEL